MHFFSATSGGVISARNGSSSFHLRITLDTQMTLALLQELMVALRANEAVAVSLGLRSALNSLEGT